MRLKHPTQKQIWLVTIKFLARGKLDVDGQARLNTVNQFFEFVQSESFGNSVQLAITRVLATYDSSTAKLISAP